MSANTDWLSLTLPPGTEWRLESRWDGAALLIRVSSDFERDSVSKALFALYVQTVREDSLREKGAAQ